MASRSHDLPLNPRGTSAQPEPKAGLGIRGSKVAARGVEFEGLPPHLGRQRKEGGEALGQVAVALQLENSRRREGLDRLAPVDEGRQAGGSAGEDQIGSVRIAPGALETPTIRGRFGRHARRP